MRKSFFLTLLVFWLGTSYYTNAQNRQIHALDGNWMFAIDSINQGINENWQNGLPPQISRGVKVPHTWSVEPGTEDYAGLAWYQKEFIIPDDLET